MKSSPIVSVSAFNVAIPTALTNEIPHLSIYNILNKHLKNTWSRQLVGQSDARYGQTFESQKLMNGVPSNLYSARRLTFADPEDGQIYSASFDKINFSVDGAFETEIDYLMHEQARYLSKLYPDDIGTLVTLTEAERQSYFNEALHSIHSYFDTEQIVAEGLSQEQSDINNLYYRLRFLTGITPIRALTGVAKQESQLLELLNTGLSKVYTGYTVFASQNLNEQVVSNAYTAQQSDAFMALDAFYFLDELKFKKQGAKQLQGKTRTDSLEDLLANVASIVNLNEGTISGSCKSFSVLNSTDPLELLDDLIYGKGINSRSFALNDLFIKATKDNLIKTGVSIDALKHSAVGDTRLDWKTDTNLYALFSYDATTREITAIRKEDLTVINPVLLEDRIIANEDATLKGLDEAYIIKLGYSAYAKSAGLALGNIIFSDITYRYALDENFRLLLGAISSSSTMLMCIDIKQNEKRVFSGWLKGPTIAALDVSKIVSRYTFEDFDEQYSIFNLFETKSFKLLLEQLYIDVEQPIEITYRSVMLLNDSLKRSATLIKDQIDGKDYTVVVSRAVDGAFEVYIKDVESETLLSGSNRDNRITLDGDKTQLRGEFQITDNTLVKIKGISEQEITYTIPNFSALNEEHLEAYDSEGNVVGKCVVGIIRSETYIDVDKLPDLAVAGSQQKISGNLVNIQYAETFEIEHKNTFLSEESSSANTLEIPIEYFEDLQTSLDRNCSFFIDTVYEDETNADYYIYTTAYQIDSILFKTPMSLLDLLSISEILFIGVAPAFYELKTLACEIFSADTLKVSENFSWMLQNLGRLNCLVLDNYGKFYASRITKIKVKNDYCLVMLESKLEGTDELRSKYGLLIIDPRVTSDINKIAFTQERRKYSSKKNFKYGKDLFFYREVAFEELLREHLNYDFNNLFSESVTRTYADDSYISRVTIIPTILSQLENLTIVDTTLNFQLFKDLLKENKSLYLDSTLKSMSNPAIETKMLTVTNDYDSISYSYSSKLPSSITFYNYPNYEEYQPLKDFLDELQKTRKEIGFEELQDIVARRLIIWGRVIWDANNVNKSVKTLRTIWSGYFTNFRIAATDDIIPAEAFVQSALQTAFSIESKNINLLNYNYAECQGSAPINWVIPIIINANSKESRVLNICDTFSHEEVTVNTIEEISEKTRREIILDSFNLTANRYRPGISKTSTVLEKVAANANKIVIDADVHFKKLSAENKPTFKYDPYSKFYSFRTTSTIDHTELEADKEYRLKLAYNMLHLENDNFKALGFLTTLNRGIAVQMIMEMFVWNWYSSNCMDLEEKEVAREALKVNFPSWTDEELDYCVRAFCDGAEDSAEWINSKQAISLDTVLDYTYNLYKNANIVPCLGCLTTEGKVKIYYYVLGKDETGAYYIYEGTTTETINGDLVKTILDDSLQAFQVKNSQYNTYLNTIYNYQYNIPAKATGFTQNTEIDIGIDVDEDRAFKITDRENVKEKQTFLAVNMSVQSKVPETEDETGVLTNFDVEDTLRYSIQDIFQDLENKTITSDTENLIVANRKYKLREAFKYFKEQYPTIVQLTAEDRPEDSVGDINRCRVAFDQDFNLESKGYLYLTDIKAPNRRSNYTPSRETKILDRDCNLSNLHIIGYQETDSQLKLLLQDSAKSYTRYVANSLGLIRPLDLDINAQGLINTNLSIGFMWSDPGLEIGYTLYKRKFVFEGLIDSSDTTKITLVDEELARVDEDDNFSLLDHISVGDQVQIILNEPSAYYQDGSKVTLDLRSGNGYVGPYKVIYSTAITTNSGSNLYVILSGPGNLAMATIRLDAPGQDIDISEPIFFDYSDMAPYAYALKSGEIVYYDELSKRTMQVASVPDFAILGTFNFRDYVLKDKIDIVVAATAVASEDNFEEIIDDAGNVAYRVSLNANSVQEEPLVGKHDDWYVFGVSTGNNTEEGDETAPRSESDVAEEDAMGENPDNIIINGDLTTVFTNIPLNTGHLNFDNKDRIFFESDDDDASEETLWMAYPDKAEDFKLEEYPNAFSIVEDNGYVTYVDIESASDNELQNFIRDAVKDMFSEYPNPGDGIKDATLKALLEKGEASAEEIEQLNPGLLSELIKPRTKDTYNLDSAKAGSAADASTNVLARILSGQSTGTWDLNKIRVPEIVEKDLPVYFKAGEAPKWKKCNVLTNNIKSSSLETAASADLKAFAKALLPVKYITREAPTISSYSRNSKNLVIWDQNTSTLSIFDKTGRLQKRIAIADTVIEHPLLSSQIITQGTSGQVRPTRSYSYSNSLFAYGTTGGINEYIQAVERVNPIQINGKTYNIYSLFGLDSGNIVGASEPTYGNKNAPLYLPEILKNYKMEDFTSAPELAGETLTIQNLLDVVKDEKTYQDWLKNCLYLDFMTAATSEYVAFKDRDYALNIPLLLAMFDSVSSLSAQRDYLKQVMRLTNNSLDGRVTKGLPYFTVETEDWQDIINAKLTAIPVLPESPRNFESLIQTSNIEVTSGYVHIYGTINWPDENAIRDRLKRTIASNFESLSYNSPSAEFTNTLNEMIDSYTQEVVWQLKEKRAKFTNSPDYKTGEASFKLTVDLMTGSVSVAAINFADENSLGAAGKDTQLLSLTAVGEGITAITTTGTFNLGSEDSKTIAPETSEFTEFTGTPIKTGTKLLVYEGLKASKIFTDIAVDASATLEMDIKGMPISNPDIFYSSVAVASDKELQIMNDTIVLNDGERVTATILVRDYVKDNFKLGYGDVTNLSEIPAMWTLFEVKSDKFADFVTYDNNASASNYSSEIGKYVKDSVFDLYPTFEQIDKDKKGDFYKLDSEDNIQYLKNSYGRYILRVSEVTDADGGKLIAEASPKSFADIFIGRDETEDSEYTAEELAKVPAAKTLANEWITPDFLAKLALKSTTRLNSVALPDKRLIGKEYNTLVNMYSVQRVPSLVENAWDAVLTNPYKSFDVDITKGSNVELGENYLIATFDTAQRSLTPELPRLLAEQSKLDSSLEVIVEANRVQAQNIDPDFEAFPLNAVADELNVHVTSPSEVLPRLVDITKYRLRTDTDSNLRIDTRSNELYIPSKGYGQALLGNYTVPEDCLFEDGIFYELNKKTLNANGEQFVLVHEDGTPWNEGETVYIPKMVYKSFSQANQDLSQELATKEDMQLCNSLIDMSRFQIGYNSFYCDDSKILQFLDFTGNSQQVEESEKIQNVYEIFQNGLRFSGKLIYSELPKDPTATSILNLSDCEIQDNMYTNLQLIDCLKPTRTYARHQVPCNVRFLNEKGYYELSKSTISRDLKAYSVDEDGNLLYMNQFGELTTDITLNPNPVPAIRAVSNVSLFSISDTEIQAMVRDCFYITGSYLKPIKDSSTFVISEDKTAKIASILAIVDPNQATLAYSIIQDVTDEVTGWKEETSFKFVFNDPKDLKVRIEYENYQVDPHYNFAYIKTKDGELIAKLFFKKPLNLDSIVVFQKEV